MKTDKLIDMLSAGAEAVDSRQVTRHLGWAVAAGGLFAVCAILLALGSRPGAASVSAAAFLAVKLVFTFGLAVGAAFFLARLARPGGERRTNLAVMAAPFLAVILFAAVNLALAPVSHWEGMILADNWLECLVSIPVIAVLPFAVIVLAMRSIAAPTDLVRAGALVGLAAGSLSAMGYAIHCTGDSLPFVALWYSATITLCTIAGAALGPRLLRW